MIAALVEWKLRGGEKLLFGEALQAFACKFMRGIGFTADVSHDAPSAPASFAYFMNRGAKAVARWHPASHNGGAIRAHDHAVIGPPRGRQIKRTRAHVCLELRRSTDMRKAERLCVDGPPPNKNGQAASGPAVLVQRGVHVDHQALPQTAFLPYGGRGGRPVPPGFRKSLTLCCGLVPWGTQHLGLIGGRQLGPHRVVAAVDVQELAGGQVQVVREQHGDRPPDR